MSAKKLNIPPLTQPLSRCRRSDAERTEKHPTQSTDQTINQSPSSLLQLILLTRPHLHRRPLMDAVDILQQMRKRLHLFFSEAAPLPIPDPRPRANVRDRILALAVTSQILARAVGVFAREVDLEHAEDAQGFVAEPGDGVWDAG